MARHITSAQKTKMRKLRKQGLTYKAIAEEMGTTENVANYWCNRNVRNKKRAYCRAYIKGKSKHATKPEPSSITFHPPTQERAEKKDHSDFSFGLFLGFLFGAILSSACICIVLGT